jgi:Outer membrane protein beta-barrel domain
MKKIFLLVLTSICLAVQLYAQTEKKICFGIKGGLNHTVINGYETNGDKTGFIGTTVYGAFFAETHIGSTTFLVTELLFSWVNDWHFIEVPFHIKQMLNHKLGVFLGPKLDFAADKFDNSKKSKSGFCGLSIETGTQFNFTKRIFAEGRYSIGLSEQFRDESFDINDGKRNNFRLGVGFRF